MPCTTPAYASRFAASGLKPSKSISADQLGVQIQAFPAYPILSKPSPCQQLATNRQCVPPPPFPLGGEEVGLRQLEHLHPHFKGGGRTSPHLFPGPGDSGRHPHHPLTTPGRKGLARWTTPPSSTHAHRPAPNSWW